MGNIVKEEVMWDLACSNSFEESSQFCTLKYVISSWVQRNYSPLTLPYIRAQESEQMPFPCGLISSGGVTQKKCSTKKPISGNSHSKTGLRFCRDLFGP